LQKLKHIIKESRLRLLGHVLITKNRQLRNSPLSNTVGIGGATRESRNGEEKTGWTLSDKTWRTWTLPGKKPKNMTID